MKFLHSLAPGALLFIIILSACGSTAPEVSSSPEPVLNIAESEKVPPISTPVPTVLVDESQDTSDMEPISRESVEKARTDLMKRLDISSDQIRVVEAMLVDWPDTSLGCPQPGMVYAQVITPGYYIVLEAKEQQYPYHTDLEEQVILCLGNLSDAESEVPPRPVIPANPDEIDDGEPWVPVD